MGRFVVKMTKNKNFLSPKATIYGKNDQKCFCLQWLSPIWSHFMITLTKNISQCTNTNVYTQNKFPIMFNWSPNVNLFLPKWFLK